MRVIKSFFYLIVAASRRAIAVMAIVMGMFAPAALSAQDKTDMDALFAQLAKPEGEAWRIAEADILREWSQSGSAAMDLLLKRGEEALDAGNTDAAIGHLTALTDHAPDFATGWQTRSTAYALIGQYGPAVSDLARALELEPRHFGALTQMGFMFEEMGDNERALSAYKESLKIHPHQQEVKDGIARLEKLLSGTEI